jgi:hypothetical protein
VIRLEGQSDAHRRAVVKPHQWGVFRAISFATLLLLGMYLT